MLKPFFTFLFLAVFSLSFIPLPVQSTPLPNSTSFLLAENQRGNSSLSEITEQKPANGSENVESNSEPADSNPEQAKKDQEAKEKEEKEKRQKEEEAKEKEYNKARMAFLFDHYDVALKIWLPMAENGYAKAQATIAWMYHTGKGLNQDYKKAYEWYLKAANQGHSIAMNNIGVLFENGWGVKKNYADAVKWYRDAAELGYSYAQYNLGLMLLNGKGAKKDKTKATYWLGLASLQGVKQAQELVNNDHAKPPSSASQPSSMFRHGTKSSKDKSHMNIGIKRDSWLLAQNPEYYTLELFHSEEENALLRYIHHNGITGAVAYFKIKAKNGKEEFSLVYGTFSTYENAEKKLKTLPPEMTKWTPWIRKFSQIQLDNAVETC